MQTDYTVKITPQAQSQLGEIANYIRYALKEPQTALRTLETLEKEIYSLSYLPNRVPLISEEPWRGQGVHKLSVKNFLVYFIVQECEKVVQVFAVIYARRDQAQQLKNIDFE